MVYLGLYVGPAAHQILLVPQRSFKSLKVNFISGLRTIGWFLCFQFLLGEQLIDIDAIGLVDDMDG